jgi:hypothetical protein
MQFVLKNYLLLCLLQIEVDHETLFSREVAFDDRHAKFCGFEAVAS